MRKNYPGDGSVDKIVVLKYHVSVNCKAQTSAMREWIYMDKNGTPTGPNNMEVPPQQITWDSISPDSNMEVLGDAVCKAVK